MSNHHAINALPVWHLVTNGEGINDDVTTSWTKSLTKKRHLFNIANKCFFVPLFYLIFVELTQKTRPLTTEAQRHRDTGKRQK